MITTTNSLVIVICNLVLVILSLLGLNYDSLEIVSWLCIILIDLYLIAVLSVAAIKTDSKREKKWWGNNLLPTTTVSLPIFGLLFITVILGFAGLYHQSGGGIIPSVTNSFDAVYFSFKIITTLGYGNFEPATFTKCLVMWEFGTGVLLFAGGFGLLISRLSKYK